MYVCRVLPIFPSPSGLYVVLVALRFYGSRVEDAHDGIPKFLGKKGDMPYEQKD